MKMFSYTGIFSYFHVFVIITNMRYSNMAITSYSNATSLYDISLSRYVYVRPVIGQSKPMQINIALYLSKLRKFDEICGEHALTAYFEIIQNMEIYCLMKSFGNLVSYQEIRTMILVLFLTMKRQYDFNIIGMSHGSQLILSKFPVKRTSVIPI